MRISRFPVCAAILITVAPSAFAGQAPYSKADIDLGFDLSHMTVSVSQGESGGCMAGYVFQAPWNGCVRESLDRDLATRPCAEGFVGVQTRERSRTRYSHQNGSVRHGSYTSWSDWSGTCSASPETPADPGHELPKVGHTYLVDAWICDSTNAHYAFPAGPADFDRDKLISTYRNFNFYDRCPERLGYRFWIDQWNADATAHAQRYGVSMAMAYEVTFAQAGTGIRKRMLDAARLRGEHLSSIIDSMDAECQYVANSTYGAGRITAVYDRQGNGSRCKVVQVH